MDNKSIFKLMDKASVISFDIFDTLLVRPYMRPSDMFFHLEKVYNCPGFSEQRGQAEQNFYLQNGTNKEADIDDIYTMMPNFSDMKQRELDWELKTITANSEMLEIYKYAIQSKKTVVICSDMYLPLSFIKKLLKNNGITEYSKIYLSNTINHRKDRGDIYDYMVQDLNIKPSKILHIGDNKKSDINQAKKHGLVAYQYQKISDVFLNRNIKFRKFYKSQHQSLGCSILTAMVSQRNTVTDYWGDFGYKYAAPIVYSYTRWIYDEARKNELNNILFIARDGYLMEKVFNTFNKHIKTNYVYAPRILNYTANLDYDIHSKQQARIVCDYFQKNYGNLSPQKFIEKNLAEFTRLAEEEKKKTGYQTYIQNLVDNEKVVGVVDSISGQLSGQRLIAKESNTETFGFYLLTLSGQKKTYDIRHHDYFTDELRDLFVKDFKCDLMELIFSAPENPIISVSHGKPIHNNKTNEAEIARQQIYKKIEKGVLAFAKDVNKRFGGENIYFSPLDALALLDIYATRPEKADIQAMFAVKRSPYADNSVYVPLFSAPIPFWKIGKIKKLIWLTPMQRLSLFLFCPIKVQMRGLKRIKIEIFGRIPRNIFKISFGGRYEFSIGSSNLPISLEKF